MPGSPIYGRPVDIYLQGSYANSTHTRGDSDVDVVVELRENHYGATNRLPYDQQLHYNAHFNPHPYTWPIFRADVLAQLRARYGGAVQERNKCLTVAGEGRRLRVDVVVATQYMDFSRFYSWQDEHHISGITFWTQREDRQITNWPKQHIANGEAKNARERTAGNYKPGVRMVKNARAAAVETQILAESDAPSFFVECLLYNVPDDCFTASRENTMYSILAWLEGRDIRGFYCGNEIVPLFGPSPEQWSIDAAYRTVQALIALWNNWA
jgi:Nucleotidyltransferase domain